MSNGGTSNQLRIISGKWRGRKIEFPDVPGLRPTQDRIRETVFNWLAPHIEGAHCLDLFAGSGAFGFEALSRAAAQVFFVDQSKQVVSALQATKTKLAASNACIRRATLPGSIDFSGNQFDLVFIDPPYQHKLLEPTLKWLLQGQLLQPSALVYIEYSACEDLTLSDSWQRLKSKKTSSLCYGLLRLDSTL